MSRWAYPACKAFQDTSFHGSEQARQEMKEIMAQERAEELAAIYVLTRSGKILQPTGVESEEGDVQVAGGGQRSEQPSDAPPPGGGGVAVLPQALLWRRRRRQRQAQASLGLKPMLQVPGGGHMACHAGPHRKLAT